jgi:hypothetical protein
MRPVLWPGTGWFKYELFVHRIKFFSYFGHEREEATWHTQMSLDHQFGLLWSKAIYAYMMKIWVPKSRESGNIYA